MNRRQLLKELKALRDKDYRDTYLRSLVRLTLAQQIRAIRGKEPQAEFASRVGVSQSVVSERLENGDYSGLKVDTLLDIACALNLGLLVRFVDYPELLTRQEDASPSGLKVSTLNQSIRALSTQEHDEAAREAAFLFPSTGIITGTGVAQWSVDLSSTSLRPDVPGQTPSPTYTPTMSTGA